MTIQATEYYVKNALGEYEPVHFKTDAGLVKVEDTGGFFSKDNTEEILGEIGDSLAKNAKQTELRFDKITSPRNHTGAIIGFIDDDGESSVLTNWGPILEAKGINIGACIQVNKIGTPGYLTLDELHAFEDAGNEIYSHTMTHPLLSVLTEEQLDTEFGDSQEYFRQNGFKNTNILVYPTGLAQVTQLVKDTARKYYEYCVDAGGGVATIPFDNMCIKRVSVGYTIDQLKAYLDAAVASGDLMLVMTHSWGTFDAEKISALIDYAVSLNVLILKPSEIFQLKGNVVGAGEYTGKNFFYLSRDGKVRASNFQTSKYGTSTSFDALVTVYPINTVTVEMITDANATIAPIAGVGGALITIRFADNGFSYQEYVPRTGTYRKRRNWNGTAWLAWMDDSDMKSKYGNANSFTNSLTAYPTDKITYELITAANAASAPAAGQAGILITYRFTDSTYSFQEYKVYNSKTKYTRSWGGPWGAWEQIV